MSKKFTLAVGAAVAALVAGSLTALPAAGASDPAASAVGSLAGKVTYLGAPIAYASVAIYDAWSADGTPSIDYVTTDETGAFVAEDLSAGKAYTAAVQSDESQAFLTTYAGNTVRHPDAATYTIAAGTTVTAATIAAIPGGAITGKVVSSAGKPVAGVYVYASSTKRSGHANAVTDADGRYTLRGLPAGAATVTAFLDKRSGAVGGERKPTQLVVKTGSTISAKTLTIKAPSNATGTVKGYVKTSSKTGTGQVTLYPAGNVLDYGGWTGVPTSTGKVTIKDVPVGTYDVVVRGTAKVKRITVKKGKTASFGTIKLGKSAALKGVVTTSSGKRAKGGSVAVTDAKGRYHGGAVVSAKGVYVVKGLGAGTYRITTDPATDKGQAAKTVTVKVKAGKTLKKNLAFANDATISGVVKNGTKPVAGITVYVASKEGAFGWVVTDAKGRFTVAGLTKGTYTLMTADTYEGGYQDTTVRKSVKVAKAGQTIKNRSIAVRR